MAILQQETLMINEYQQFLSKWITYNVGNPTINLSFRDGSYVVPLKIVIFLDGLLLDLHGFTTLWTSWYTIFFLGVFCTFWLQNVLRGTAACNFWSLLRPDGSAPAALASLLFGPPEPQNIGRFRDFSTFSYLCCFIYPSEVWLLNFLWWWC